LPDSQVADRLEALDSFGLRMAESEYTREFFEKRADKRRSSAEAIVPLAVELIAPRSVIDLGCGAGGWLAAFAAHGIDDYLGVDGDWVPADTLEIPRDRFVTAHLERPFSLDREFDLAVSLEVGEHLPESAAKTFVESLVGLAPCVLFSAAVPRQGGRHHVNEQWPQYWAELFAGHGYQVVDAIRPRIWSAPDVSWWYKQNTLVYAREEVIAARPALVRDRAATVEAMLAVVHPRMLDYVAADPEGHMRRPTATEYSLRDLSYAFPRVVARSVRWRAARLRDRVRGRGNSG
jgi:SAM-dependent methyltransferase